MKVKGWERYFVQMEIKGKWEQQYAYQKKQA